MPALREEGLIVTTIDRNNTTGSLVIHTRRELGKQPRNGHTIEVELSNLAGVPVTVVTE